MRKLYSLFIGYFMASISLAQNIGIGTNTPHPSAGLEVNSTSKGVLFPRVTIAERNAIANPATGLMVFDVEKNLPYYYNGNIWVPLGPISPKEVPPVEISSGNFPSAGSPTSVTISGIYAAAGLTNFDTLGVTDIGAVQIYKKTNGVWAKSQLIVTPDELSGQRNFGYSLDMAGDYLVVGAPYNDVLSTVNSGKVYVYKLNSATGNFEFDGQITHPSGLLANSQFGYSVAITINSPVTNNIAIAIGSPLYSASGTVGRGSVSVFRRGGTKNYIHLNTIFGTQDNAILGHSVDIDANLVAMGSPFFDTTINNINYSRTGRVQVNAYNGTNYATTERVFKPTIDTNMCYGYRIALSGNSLIMSGYESSLSGNSGYPIQFKRSSATSWLSGAGFSDIQKRFDPDRKDDLVMGYNMAFTNSLFILGISHSASHAFGGNTFGNLGEYALLYISKSDNFTYTYYTQLKPPDNQLSTLYGYAVAASGNDYIISMPNGKSTDGNNGAVYFGNIKE